MPTNLTGTNLDFEDLGAADESQLDRQGAPGTPPGGDREGYSTVDPVGWISTPAAGALGNADTNGAPGYFDRDGGTLPGIAPAGYLFIDETGGEAVLSNSFNEAANASWNELTMSFDVGSIVDLSNMSGINNARFGFDVNGDGDLNDANDVVVFSVGVGAGEEYVLGGAGFTYDAFGSPTDPGPVTLASNPDGSSDEFDLEDDSTGRYRAVNVSATVDLDDLSPEQRAAINGKDLVFEARVGGTPTAGSGGTGIFIDDIRASIDCYVAGTRILCRGGWKRVEDLRKGDLVKTIDSDWRPIQWIWSSKVHPDHLSRRENLRPIRISKGSLGGNLPELDLIVSRQHRMMLCSPIVEEMFGVSEVFVPAVFLTILDGVDLLEPEAEVEYWHLLFETHQVIIAEGVPSESFYPGKMAMTAISESTKELLIAEFGSKIHPDNYGPLARIVPEKGKLGRACIETHQTNQVSILDGWTGSKFLSNSAFG